MIAPKRHSPAAPLCLRRYTPGSSDIRRSEMTQQTARMSDELESRCDRCSGRGGWYVEGRGDWHRCGACAGSGFVPTAQGKKILDLMRHNFKPMLEDTASN